MSYHHLLLAASAAFFCAAPAMAADAPQAVSAAPSADVTASTATAHKKILVVFYSRTGHTKKIALDLAKKIDADTEEVVDTKDRSGAMGYMIAGKDASGEKTTEILPSTANPANYTLVVIGTPIWAWNMTPAIRAYITAHKAEFKNVAFFTSAGSTKPDKIVKKLEALSGKTAKASAGFFDKDQTEKHKAAYAGKLDAFAKALLK
jgi:flavodoxin